jgi:hypothetical protein
MNPYFIASDVIKELWAWWQHLWNVSEWCRKLVSGAECWAAQWHAIIDKPQQQMCNTSVTHPSMLLIENSSYKMKVFKRTAELGQVMCGKPDPREQI